MCEQDPRIHISVVSVERHLFNLYIVPSIRDRIWMIDRFISQSVPFGCIPPASPILGISAPSLHKYYTPLFVRCHTDKNFSSGRNFIGRCTPRERRGFICL